MQAEGSIPGRAVAVDRAGGSVDVLTGSGTLRLHRLMADNGVTAAASTVVSSVRSTLDLDTVTLVGELVRLRALVDGLGSTGS